MRSKNVPWGSSSCSSSNTENGSMASRSTVSGWRVRRRYSLMKACRRIVSSHPFALVPFSNWCHARYALSIVSWTRSSASAGLPVRRRATRYRLSRCTRASRSKLARLSASAAGLRAGGGGVRGGGGGGGGVGAVMAFHNLSPRARVPQWPRSNGSLHRRPRVVHSQQVGTGLGFARRGAQHRPSRRPRGGQEPRHAGRGRVVGIRRGAAVQAARPLGHGGDAVARIRGHGPAGRAGRPLARRGAAPPGGAAARCGPGFRGRRPARGATGGTPPLRAHAARRTHGPAGPRVRRRPARGARRVRRGSAPREPHPRGPRRRRARRAGDARRRGVRAVRRRVHRAAPAPRGLRRGDAPHLLPGDRRRGVRMAGGSARSATRLMPLLDGFDLAALAPALGALGADGWLLYDFRRLNPIAGRILGDTGMGTRRLFVLLPRAGLPIAVVHRIELQALADFPGEVRPYGGWRELHGHLEALVRGRTLAIEISLRDQVPYLDRVPYGVVQLLESLGARLVSSAPLVSRFAARWSAAELAGHRKAAEILAAVAREALTWVGSEAARGAEVRETGVQQRVRDAMERAGLWTDDGPIVAFGPTSAMPHYEPHPGADRRLAAGDVVLLDLWGGPGRGSGFVEP